MGKGQRVRATRAAEKEAMKATLAKNAKKKQRSTIAMSVIAIILVLCVVGSLAYSIVHGIAFDRGDIQRKAVVLETENYKVDAAMMSYFFYSQYNSFVSSLASSSDENNNYLSMYGLDTTKPLRSQKTIFSSDGSSWFDYIASESASQVKELLYRAEKGIETGKKLDDADQANIQEQIDYVIEAAAENSIKEKDAFSAYFGTGVKEGDVRKCLELAMMANKYYDEFSDALVYTDDEIDAYYKKNIDSYRYVDYYSYDVVASDTKDSKTYAAAKARAEQLAALKDTKAFAAWVEKDYRDNNPVSEDLTEEDLKENLDEILTGLSTKKMTLQKDDEISDWLFNDAKVGDTKINDDESGKYTVYLLTATPYRDEQITKNIRQIVFLNSAYDKKDETTKAKAEEVKAALEAAGYTEEAFLEKAEEFSADSATASVGGLCENYKSNDFDATVSTWVFDAKRKSGDVEILKIEDGYVLCYFVGDGLPAWKADCVSAKKDDDYSAAYEEWVKNIPLTENKDSYDKIPDITD